MTMTLTLTTTMTAENDNGGDDDNDDDADNGEDNDTDNDDDDDDDDCDDDDDDHDDHDDYQLVVDSFRFLVDVSIPPPDHLVFPCLPFDPSATRRAAIAEPAKAPCVSSENVKSVIPGLFRKILHEPCDHMEYRWQSDLTCFRKCYFEFSATYIHGVRNYI